MQDDSLLATTTPREALRFSAYLRLPSSVTGDEVNARVENLLDELGLMECANVYIGNAVLKGISGGQRKRTSVGVELITDPTVSIISSYQIIVLSNLIVICDSYYFWMNPPQDWIPFLPSISSNYLTPFPPIVPSYALSISLPPKCFSCLIR